MNVRVIHASRLGATREIAERIAATLRSVGVAATAQPADDVVDGRDADAYVVGSAVYGGHWLDEATRYVRRNAPLLATKPVWLFSSGPIGVTRGRNAQADPGEVPGLRSAVHARGHRTFAGSFDRKRVEGSDLTGLLRFIAERSIPEGDYRDWHAIDAWARSIGRELTGPRPS